MRGQMRTLERKESLSLCLLLSIAVLWIAVLSSAAFPMDAIGFTSNLFGVSKASAQEAAPTTAAPAVGESNEVIPSPWAGQPDVPPPPFLDATDRRVRDTRPPPSAEQVRALRELEAEVGRFTKAGTSYQDALRSILRREYVRRRRDAEQGYARQIREEERLQNESRDRAIELFERFVRRYPDDPTYTPDAMFRLGELYYERSAIDYQNAALSEDPATAAPHPDFTPTVDLYRRLVRNFQNYRRIDGVFYLIGYCLNEMGELEEARMAWLNLVCANHYRYTGTRPEVALPAEDPQAAVHPSLTMDAEPVQQELTGEDPYGPCLPVVPTAEFASETWLRIGEYHFDFDFDPAALDRAVSAYRKVLADPQDRNYNLALYKVAWSFYRANRFQEAVEHFARLVDWSDREQERTGRAGSELRAEAVQYLGITFAFDDWNDNRVPDPDEGGPTGLMRIQDASLLAQDRPWTIEVYMQLGQVYFDEAKYDLAIRVWEMALSRFPLDHRAPDLVNQIARAHQRRNEMDLALAARARLAQYGEGSEWWQNNLDHPLEQRAAEQLAESSLVNEALQHHQTAQRLRRNALENGDDEMLQRALAEYNTAAEAYRRYLERYPNSPNAYELHFNLADALFWSNQFEAAAAEYASVRDSNLDDQFLSESARRVVESLKRLADEAAQQGSIELRSQPPEATGEPPTVTPVEMPEMVQRLAQAREVYLARVEPIRDSEHVRGAYDYNNTLLLYFYGYWDQARERFRRIYLERCTGPEASEEGRVAWTNLRNMAVMVNDMVEVERLANDFQRRRCTFAPSNEPAQTLNCDDPANEGAPECLATSDLTDIRFRRALEVFRSAEQATGDEQRRLYEDSATQLIEAVNVEPDHRDAPVALIRAALALERTSRFESASRIYQRVVDEVGPRRPTSDEDQVRLDGILGEAYFRLAYTANRFFDYERAVENYRVLADSERFQRSAEPQMAERRTDALINAARILEYQQDYTRAAQYYRRAADALASDANEQRAAYFRVAEMTFKRRDWAGAMREMRAFIDRYQRDAGAGELVVTAYWRIAEARKELRQTREYMTALQDVVTAFERSGQEPASAAAELAAQARFEIVDANPEVAAFNSFALNPGSPATLQAYVEAIRGQITVGTTRASAIVESYVPVFAYRRGTWTVAASSRQGRVQEVFARAILNAPFVMPADLARQTRSAQPEVREEIRTQVEDRIRQVLDAQVRQIECFAVKNYALAARFARASSLDNEFTRFAIDRLQAYGDERIGECITEARTEDPTLAPYTAGEFVRARRGQTLGVEPGRSAPTLATDE